MLEKLQFLFSIMLYNYYNFYCILYSWLKNNYICYSFLFDSISRICELILAELIKKLVQQWLQVMM